MAKGQVTSSSTLWATKEKQWQRHLIIPTTEPQRILTTVSVPTDYSTVKPQLHNRLLWEVNVENLIS